MHRIEIEPRANLAERVAETGFEIATIDGEPYWTDSAYYAFSLKQIESDLEAASADLAALCLELVGRVVRDERALALLQIPEHAWNLIAASWKRGEPSLYGRLDLAYDGENPPKLLEYNADTPTALFEAAVFQWHWLEDGLRDNRIPAGSDQFNSVHEKLIARFGQIGASRPGGLLHLACMPESTEDRGLIAYLDDCARQAGLSTTTLAMTDIGSAGQGPFVDLANRPIELLFKLYPWEWMFRDSFSRSASMQATRFLEPPWKAVLSNKGILPLLWEMAPGHPNLLPAYFEADDARKRLGGTYARKPLYSREGANITLMIEDQIIDHDEGAYGQEGFIVQGLAGLRCFDGNYPVIGSWIIGESACGIGIREDNSPITKNTSRFVPHAILQD